MFESRNRLLAAALAAAVATVGLSGCEASKDGPPSPPPPTQIFKAEFNTTAGAVPYPTDLFFLGTTDGTLELPATIAWRPASNRDAMNALDGWSTTAPIKTRFSMPVNGSTLTATTVRMVELYLSNTTKAPAGAGELPPGVTSPVRRVLTAGTDFTVTVSNDIDAEGRIIQITPLKPLTPSTGLINIGYLVILTNGIQSADGRSATPDDQYASYVNAPADCSNFAANTSNNALCRLTKGHLAIAQAVGTAPSSVVLTWGFSTQSTEDTLDKLNEITTAQAINVIPTGLTTQQANAALQGKANLYVGATTLPYYLTPATPGNERNILTKFWTAAGPSAIPGINPASRNLTRFNAEPLKVADVSVPLLVTVPNDTAAGGTAGSPVCVKPANGWPVVIVQHGITGNRTQALAMADSYADACFVVAAIDLPLHGLVPNYTTPAATSPLYCSPTTPNPLCLGATERHFNVDLINNTTSAATPDGKIDASGAHIINIPSPLTSRDNLRQAASDINVLSKSLVNLDLTGDGVADIDPSRIHLTGLSLGAMVATVVADHTPLATVTASAAGGRIVDLLLDSPTFGPTIKAGLSAQLVIGSYVYNLFAADLQTVIDSGDPVNHVAGAASTVPYHLQKITGDTVVPNSATDRLIAAAGLGKLTALGPNAVAAGDGAYSVFTAGSHGTLFDPTASLPATVEAQTQAVTFGATFGAPGGPFVVQTNPSVLNLN